MTAPDCFRLEHSPGGACTHWKSAALSRRTPVAACRVLQKRTFRTSLSGHDRSFDHLVGTEQQGLRHRDAKRLGGFEVDHQLELGRLLNRNIGRSGAAKYLGDHP